jgi:hypothetical protein
MQNYQCRSTIERAHGHWHVKWRLRRYSCGLVAPDGERMLRFLMLTATSKPLGGASVGGPAERTLHYLSIYIIYKLKIRRYTSQLRNP